MLAWRRTADAVTRALVDKGSCVWRAQADVKASCKDAKADEGGVQECLAKNRPSLSWDCQEQLFRQEVENADDVRLSVRLFRACLADKKKVRRAHGCVL